MDTPAQTLIEACDRDGFVVVRSFFEPEMVEKARRELEPTFDHPSSPKQPNFILSMAVPGKSPTLDLMFEKIFTDPLSTGLIEGVAGKYIKARDINARKMTGLKDNGDLLHQALQWHRDGGPEFGIGIFLTDVDPGGPATGFVKGSHKWSNDPQWHVLLGRPFYPRYSPAPPWKKGIGILTRLNPFARMLWKKEIAPRIDAAYGKQGDFYIFLNQAWHNRMNNETGAQSIVVLASLFPTEEELTVGAPVWPQETIDRMPPTFARILARTLPKNQPSNTVLRKAINGQKVTQTGLFAAARRERSIVSGLSIALQTITDPISKPAYNLSRAGYHVGRALMRRTTRLVTLSGPASKT